MWFRFPMEWSGRNPHRHVAALALSLLFAAACSPSRPERDDRFTASGEVIALGGGDRGVSHACANCHGLSGEGDGAASPRLAGLPEGYLVKQLQDYADGRRADPIMGPIARALSADARQKVSGYYSALPSPPVVDAPQHEPRAARLYHLGDPKRAIVACADCHGVNGEGIGPAQPPVAGQSAGYLATQLFHWREAERQNDPTGVMLQVSLRLTPQEIRAISAYMAGLGGSPAAPETAPSRP